MRLSHTFLAACLTFVCSHAAFATDVAMCTDQGRVVLELADAQSPKHVQNFLAYVDTAHYSGTVFHRVHREPGLAIVQGGGFDRQLRGRRPLPPVENESRNGLSNVRGSVAAARTADPHSAHVAVLREPGGQHGARRGRGVRLHGLRPRHGRHPSSRSDQRPPDRRVRPVPKRRADAARGRKLARAARYRRAGGAAD